jgi:hypothetical protein
MNHPLTLLFLTLLALALFCGCAYQGPPISFTGSYTTQEGATVGGVIRLDPSFAKQKK